jgi:hypothetical protein
MASRILFLDKGQERMVFYILRLKMVARVLC